LDLGQYIVDEIVVVYFGIDRLGRVSSLRRRNERNARRIVVRGRSFGWLPLGQDYQRAISGIWQKEANLGLAEWHKFCFQSSGRIE